MTVEPIDEKFEAFGWHVIKADGHDFESLEKAFEERKKVTGKPALIIAETIKGKGCSFMEGKASWHGKAPNYEEFCMAMEEIGGGLNG